MAKQFVIPDYKPYPTPAAPKQAVKIPSYVPSKNQMIRRLTDLMWRTGNAIEKARENVAAKTLINTGRDTTLANALNGVWDEGTELPLLIYEVTATSANAKHQYIADAALNASRGVSGDYSLDMMDIFKMVQQESAYLLTYLEEGGPKDTRVLESCQYLLNSLANTLTFASMSSQYNTISENYFKSKGEGDPVVKARETQKEIHEALNKVNSSLSASKQTWVEITRTAKTFYTDKLKKLNTTYVADVVVSSDLLRQRADIIDDTNRKFFQAVSAGNSLRDSWQKKSSISNLTPQDISEQAYVSSTDRPGGTSLGTLSTEQIDEFYDLSDVFVRKQGYTTEDAKSIVAILNSLPETHTYVRAGIINVRAEERFVEDLLQTINTMPTGSTLISGAMIGLIGDKTLYDFQSEVERGDYGGGYNTVEDLVEALNALDEEGYTGTILLPGVIGLTGDDSIREAIIAAINNSSENKTLIGAGAVLITGETTLDEQAVSWDAQIGTLTEDLASLEEDQSETGTILNFWTLTGTTLIDGAKIMTGSIIVDEILSGLSPIATTELSISHDSGTGVIDILSTKRLLEIRAFSSPNTYFSWPTNASYLQYKIRISPDNSNWAWVRGSQYAFDTLTRSQYQDSEGADHDQPILIPLAGNHCRYIEITFGGFFTEADALIDGEDLSGSFRTYAAAAYVSGGDIFANSITIGAFDEDLTNQLNDATEAANNFNNRNDRKGNNPANPTVASTSAAVTSTINTDGTSNVTFKWTF
jgi:hypothetical protein